MKRGTFGSRALVTTLLAGLQLNLVAAPLARGEDVTRAKPEPAARTLRASVDAAVTRADVSRSVETQDPHSTPGEPGRPFFKTPRGIVTAILMAGGLGWVIYSTSHDRVRSPANN